MSRSVGWVLSQCPELLMAFLKRFADSAVDPDTAVIKCQVADKNTGRTDVEIQASELLHIIVEAKRGSELPGEPQLKQYAKRLCSSRATLKLIIVLTNCSPSYTKAHLLVTEIAGIGIQPVSWAEFAQLASDTRRRCTLHQRFLKTPEQRLH